MVRRVGMAPPGPGTSRPGAHTWVRAGESAQVWAPALAWIIALRSRDARAGCEDAVPFTRDPLSPRYDRSAGQMLQRAISAFPSSPKDPPWIRGIFDSPAGDPREVRAPQLTRHQRAFQRALYYNPLIYHRSPVKAW